MLAIKIKKKKKTIPAHAIMLITSLPFQSILLIRKKYKMYHMIPGAN